MTEVEKKSGIYESNDGNDVIVDGEKYPITIPVANWIRDKKYQSGLNVTFEIKEQNGRTVVTKVYPTPAGKPAPEPTKEEIDRSREEYNTTAAKMAKPGFGQPTPGPSPDTAHKEVPAARAPDELFTDAEVAVMRARADAAMAAKGKETEKVDGIAKICADTKARNEAMNNVPVAIQTRVPMFDEKQVALIQAKCAPNCTPTEFQLLLYMADKYKLDPLVRQIWAVKYKDAPAAIFCGRDGFLEIAHRSGQFDGMESGTRMENDEMIGWCKVYRKDMAHPFYVEVYLKEYQKPVPYSGKPGLWQTMPRIMLQKVAESSCLRRAFSVSGLYCPEEMPDGGT